MVLLRPGEGHAARFCFGDEGVSLLEEAFGIPRNTQPRGDSGELDQRPVQHQIRHMCPHREVIVRLFPGKVLIDQIIRPNPSGDE